MDKLHVHHSLEIWSIMRGRYCESGLEINHVSPSGPLIELEWIGSMSYNPRGASMLGVPGEQQG